MAGGPAALSAQKCTGCVDTDSLATALYAAESAAQNDDGLAMAQMRRRGQIDAIWRCAVLDLGDVGGWGW